VSSSGSAPPIVLELRRSRRLAGFLFVSHALALGAAAYAHLPPVAAAAVAATVLTSFVVNFRRHCQLLGRRAVRRVVYTADGQWRVGDGAGGEHDSWLEPDPTVTPELVILRLRGADGVTRTVLLLGDSADADPLRRLRARLRLG
jgi:toxin CptA